MLERRVAAEDALELGCGWRAEAVERERAQGGEADWGQEVRERVWVLLLELWRAVRLLGVGWGWRCGRVLQAWGEVWHVGEGGAEAKGEFERVKVDERGDERPRDVVCDAEEEQGTLDHIRVPPEVEAPDVLRQTRASRKRLAAAQRHDGHGRHHHRRLEQKALMFMLFQPCCRSGSSDGW